MATQISLNRQGKIDGNLIVPGSYTIQQSKVPTGNDDLVNKAYVDSAVQGLKAKESVRVHSTANINISVAPASIDGVTLVNGDRILLTGQSTGHENGIYVFNGTGNALGRASDANTITELAGAYLIVEQGTANKDIAWYCTNDRSDTLGTTAITFVKFFTISSVPLVSSGNDGLMSIAQNNKLAGIEAGAQVNANITKGEIEAKLTGAITSHTHDYKPNSYNPVYDGIRDAQTTTAPSENAVFDALAGKAASGHNHTGTYEPVISSKGTAFNKNFGNAAGTISEGNHNHSTVYADIDIMNTITAVIDSTSANGVTTTIGTTLNRIFVLAINGLIQTPGVDYTATATTITFTTAPLAGDVILTLGTF